MLKAAVSGGIVCVLIGTMQPSQAAARSAGSSQASSASEQAALLTRYCVTCHDQKLKTAGLTLDTVDLQDLRAGAEVWEKVIRKLRGGVMPPPGLPRPDKASSEKFVSWLETTIDRASADSPNPGRPAVHRLNRIEYTNAIRDLLALEIDGRSMLPADDSGYGFDNIADVLSVSPGLLERYVLAAKRISRIAVGDPTIRPSVQTYSHPYLTLTQEDRMSEDLPFGSRGGMSVRHYFPLDGEYTLRIRLQRSDLSTGHAVRGLAEKSEIDVRLDGERVSLLTIGGTSLPRQSGEDKSDAGLEVRLPVNAGTHHVGVSLQRKTWYVEGVGAQTFPVASAAFHRGQNTNRESGKIETGVDRVEIVGPFDGKVPAHTESRRRIFTCRPSTARDERRCASSILSGLARRAYRRPVTDVDVQPLLGFFDARQREAGFDAGVQAAVTRILIDPNFLFRVERDPANVPAGSAYRLNDLELASRLSFFIWSSIPDDELLGVAERGRLGEPAVLKQQVLRMLRDDRSSALLNNFFGQWLYLRNMSTVRPDSVAFPEFDENLREAFQRETQLFLESQLREDRGVLELLTADYSFVNERLARHYGIADVYGSHFRRVTFEDGRRAGLLGQGSILTVTSYANRTSPVLRGKWLLENLLGTPPPPPPPNVPPLKDDAEGQATSMRERMEQHRRNPVCAACHSQLDPLGFALENFDAVGKWRTTDANAPVDASGALPDGSRFDGPGQFRQTLLHHRDEFLRTVTQKLLTYALGRGVEPYDMPAVRAISRGAASSDYRWSSLILGIVDSVPFRMRRAHE